MTRLVTMLCLMLQLTWTACDKAGDYVVPNATTDLDRL